MSEFEWRKGLRDLGGPVQPQRDLWLDLAARLEQTPQGLPQRTPRRWLPAFAAAASLLLGAGLVFTLARQAPQDAAGPTPVAALPGVVKAESDLAALRNRDPRLAGAAVVLDSASAELKQSLEQQPDAVFLVGLLNRTYERRMKLARMGLASS